MMESFLGHRIFLDEKKIHFDKNSGKNKLADFSAAVLFFEVDEKKKTHKPEHLWLENVPDWQWKNFVEKKDNQLFLGTENGPLIILKINRGTAVKTHQGFGVSKLGIHGNIRQMTGQALAGLRSNKPQKIFFDVCETNFNENEWSEVLLAWGVSVYQFLPERFPTENNLAKKFAPDIVLICDNKKIKKEKILAKINSVNLTRHLVNLSPSDLHPKSYANFFHDLFSKNKNSNIKVKIFGPEEIKKQGLNLHYAVGQASEHGPHLVHLKYRPEKNKNASPIILVGKGITFDSGGLDIKNSAGMRLMKKDMGGSATLAGVALWLMQEKPEIACDFFLPLAENAISGNAYRPGDIYEAYSKKTVEIHNTDAEGRLLLADAISFGLKNLEKEKPKILIDVATLTGAVKVGLGADVPGLFSNNDSLAKEFIEASFNASEFCWRLPLHDGYVEQLKSSVADLSNCSNQSFGGAITAALFLRECCSIQIPWLHLDIYAWKDSPSGPYLEAGATGQMVLSIIEWLTRHAQRAPEVRSARAS